jgi:hypothetical protein
MGGLKDVQAWRETLTDFERTRWSSPQSIHNRCPIFHPDGKTKGPAIRARPMSVSELTKMSADEIALLIYRRSPSKMWALMRSMEELAATGSAVKPRSGWVKDRERESMNHAAA